MRDIKKQLLGAIGVLAVVGSSMFAAMPAFAQLTAAVPVSDANTTKQTVVDKEIGDVLLQGAVIAVVNGVNYVAQQLAYSLAVSLTSECPGQKVCWDSKPLREGITQAWQGAIGESIGTLNEEIGLGKYGLDLCNPDPRFLLQIQLGLLDELKPPAPKCDFNDIISNYSSLGEEIGSGEFLNRFKASFTPGQAPVSVSLNILNGLYAERQTSERLAVLKRINDAAAGGGFSDLRDPVSGRVTAPAEATRQQFAKSIDEQSNAREASTAIIAGQVASRAAASVAINAAQTFAQTLIARLWNRFSEGLLSTEELVANDPDLVLNAEGLLNPGRASISQAIAPRFTNNAATPRETGVIDMLLILSTCPTQGRQPMNCAVDAQLAQAARLADADPVTVRKALEKNLLHGEWPLIGPGDTARNQDPYCYTYGYCDSNLKKLRAARIIPAGWELAAGISPVGRPYKLKDVINGFDDCDPETGGRSDEFPFCHLIDPDWVLKAPLTQCRAEVNGPVPLSSTIAARTSICTDYRSCLSQDDAGNCTGGYGYCTKDQRVWRFNGQQCPAQFASCAQFTGADGNPLGLLSNTIDQGVCNAANVGCTEYAMSRSVTDQGIGGNPASKTDDWVQSYAYFNGTVRTCDSSNDGCQALLPLAGGSLNLVRNGGFEETEAVDDANTQVHPTYWAPYSQPAAGSNGYLSRDGSRSVSGTNAALLTGDSGMLIQDDITAPGGNTYTLSASLAPNSGTSAAAIFDLYFRGANAAMIDVSASDFSVTNGSIGFSSTPTFSVVTTTSTVNGVNGLRFSVSGAVAGKSARAWFTFASTNKNLQYVRLYAGQNNGQADTYLDEVQFENGGAPTAFHEGYETQPRAVHAKVAPDYLGCTGDATDRLECNKYAPVCRANEVGCNAYTPTNGDAVVPGVIAAQDRCPAECAGYDTFKQEASTFEAEKFPEYFIPATAQACSSSEVGCAQFTDVETEAIAYASSLRACVKPDDASVGTFYSWEGSDTTGYQLRLWNFKTTEGVVAMNTASDLCAETGSCTGTAAPCTALNGDSGACASLSGSVSGGSTVGVCSRADIDSGNLDCREFYDAAGNRHFRLLSKTVVASAGCRQYRITTSNPTDCAASNGRWDVSASRCLYVADLQQSATCEAKANGCRAYKGNAATNVRTIVTEDVETGLDGWRDKAGGLNSLEVSTESVTVGGHSLKIKDPSGSEFGYADFDLGNSALAGRSYSLSFSFWVRGSGTVLVSAVNPSNGAVLGAFSDDDPATAKVPSLLLSSEWRKVELGPVFLAQVPNDGVAVAFALTTGGDAFFDNISIKEVQDNITVVRGTWQTPASCDQTAYGIPSPQEMLGCREYKTRTGGTEFLRSFSRICREKAIGCAAYTKTSYTTADPYAETALAVCDGTAGSPCDYTMSDGGVLKDVCTVPGGATSCRFSLDGRVDATSGSYPDRVRIPGDNAVYLAVRAQDRCPASQESCRAMGSPVYQYDSSGTRSIKEWKEGAYIYDAAKFDTLLCRAEEVSCKAYKSSTGIAYFKDPSTRVCDYRENVGPVTVDGVTDNADNAKYSGWFVTAATGNVVCPGARLVSGNIHAIARNGDATYEEWVGSCGAQYDKCEEFVDPLDTDGTNAASLAECSLPKDRVDVSGNGATDGNGICATNGGCKCYAPTDTSFSAVLCTAERGESTCGTAGRAYYYINDKRVNGAECNGQSSLEKGCVVFDRTLDPRKLYNAKATYDASTSRNGDAVAPTTNGKLDANVILKVRPDRECAEWLACDARQATWDAQQGKWRNVCTGFTLCNQSKVGGSSEECTNAVVPEDRLLTADAYAQGERTFATLEPSGFSVPNRYPLTFTQSAEYRWGTCKSNAKACLSNDDCPSGDTCSEKKKGMCVDTSSGLPSGVKPCDTSDACSESEYCAIGPRATIRYGAVLQPGQKCDSNSDCRQTCNGGTNAGAVCGDSGDCPGKKEDGSNASCNGGSGACVTGKCFYGLSGGALGNGFDPATSPSCRAYPESDAPFPGSVVEKWNDANGAAERLKQSFRGANTCAQKNDCECSYQRYTYANGSSKFFSAGAPITSLGGEDFSRGICSGGPNDGKACNPSADNCDKENGGMCQIIKQKAVVVGWWGFCADPDSGFNINGALKEYACNLWLPVDQLAGAPDLYNQYREAGFQDANKLLYCQVGVGTQRGNTYSVVLDDERSSGADKYLQHPGGGEIDINVVNFDETEYAQNGGSPIYEYEIAEIYVDGRISFPMFRAEGTGYWEFYRNWNEESSNSPPDGTFYDLTTNSDANRCHNDDHMARTESANYGGNGSVGDEHACYGLRIYFDKTDGTGKLQRVVTGIMSDDEEGNPSAGIRITVKLRDMCKEIAYAYDPGSSDNAPWTDRLWKSSYSGIDRAHSSTRPQSGEIDMAPYGHLGTDSTSPALGASGSLAFPAATVGVPSIYEKWLPIFVSEEGSVFTWSAVNAAKDGIDSDLGATASGIPYACEGDCGSLASSRNNRGSSASNVGRDLLSGLFARVWRVYRWNLGLQQYDALTGTSEEWDLRAMVALGTSAPKIVGVNTGRCFADQGDRACLETSEGLTVNGAQAGEVFSSGDRFNVVIRFHGYADANHMPLRDVRVDFGDDGAEGGGEGYYRNHRGVTEASGGKGASICKSEDAPDSDWGRKAPEACETGYFEFQKLYLCSDPAALPACTSGNYPCSRGNACVYRPRVQITDNWGICNGICPGAPGTGNLCMDDECSNNDNAWTSYAGEVVLKPNK